MGDLTEGKKMRIKTISMLDCDVREEQGEKIKKKGEREREE